MKQNHKERAVRVGLISLGCAKNLVDAEIMLGSLMQNGIEITNDAAAADVVIVNTCSFIDSAQEESVDTILESAELREAKNRGQGLIVAGCLPQRFRNELPKLLPEVDAFIGIDQVTEVGRVVREVSARRAAKTQDGPETGAHSKSQENQRRGDAGRSTAVVGKLAELEQARPAGEHDRAESLTGTERFGKTRKLVSAESSPLVQVNERPHYIPD